MNKGVFYGKVDKGKVILDQKSVFDAFVKNFEGQRVEITLEKEGEDWSAQQFRYLYACVYQPLAEHLGYTIDEVDGVLKKYLLVVNKGTKKEYIRDKHNLNKKELAAYIDDCIRLAAEQGVVCLPANKFYKQERKEENETKI